MSKFRKQTKADTQMLALLRSALWGTSIPPEQLPASPAEWQRVFDTCDKQTILETIIPVIFAINEPTHMPSPEQIRFLKACYTHAIKTTNAHQRAIVKVFSAMEERGIHPILLKGIANAHLYKEPFHRRCGDIDFYVCPEQFDQAKAVLDGYATPEELSKGFMSGEHYEITIMGVEFELHFDICATINDETIQREMQPLKSEYLHPDKCDFIDIAGSKIRILNHQFNAMFLFLHAYKHLINVGLGFRHISDIALFMKKHAAEIDTAWFNQKVKAMNLTSQASALAVVLTQDAGLEPQYNLFQEHGASNKLSQQMLTGGNFGQYKPIKFSGFNKCLAWYITNYQQLSVFGAWFAIRKLTDHFVNRQIKRFSKTTILTL